MIFTMEQADAVAHNLQGTTKSVEQAVQDTLGIEIESADDHEGLEVIYETVDQCECCGWWFEVGELTGEGDDEEGQYVCHDCKEDGYV